MIPDRPYYQERRVVDPTTGGEKGQKLARTDLLPTDVLMAVAEHFGRGAAKYEDRNWERGFAWSLSHGALLRHLFAWWSGEDVDDETGSSHIDAVIFHAMALRAFELRGVGTDDRPKPKPLRGTQALAQAWKEAREAEYAHPTFDPNPAFASYATWNA